MVAVLHQFSPQWFYFIWESGQRIWCQLASRYVRRSFCFILGFMPTHSPPERQIRPQKYNLPLYLDDGSRATFWNIKNWELLVYVWRKGWQEGQQLQMNQFYRCDSICEVEVGRKVWLTATVITGTAHSGLQGEMWDIKIDPTYLHLHQTCGHVRAVCNMRCMVFSKSFPVSLVFNIHSNYYI